MPYWLAKSEPFVWSWAEHMAKGVEPWSGVRNHQAANNLKAMKIGDLAFFYHSNEGREIVGIMAVSREAYPDPTDETGRFVMVDFRAVKPLKRPISLTEIKGDPALSGMALLRQSRLSVSPVTPAEWAHIMNLSEKY